jgi:site-specific DNA-methyltransferase (adenine-specific)
MTDGSRAFVWSLPRTSHWTGCAVEDAGLAIETTVQHLFATGWPKGASQLKPAAETWWLARTGRSTDLNIEACRVGADSTQRRNRAPMGYGGNDPSADGYTTGPTQGRYPPNVVLSHHALCAGDVDGVGCVEGCAVAELAAQSGERASGAMRAGTPRRNLQSYSGGFSPSHATESDIESTGTAARFYPQFPADDPDAPYNAPLFRYEAKPKRAEKNEGVDLDARPADAYAAHRGRRMKGHPMRHDGEPATLAANDHPTVKPVALMRWLIRLVTKPGDVVLDPFGGSGTTGVAALLEGRRVILVEESARSVAIARQRCEHALPDVAAPVRVPAARLSVDGPLFAARGVR